MEAGGKTVRWGEGIDGFVSVRTMVTVVVWVTVRVELPHAAIASADIAMMSKRGSTQ